MSLVLNNKGKGIQSSSEQPLVWEEHCMTTLITAAKETFLLKEAQKGFFGCYSVCETIKDTKEG